MIEDVEEVAHGAVVRAQAFADERRVIEWKDTLGTCQPHEIDEHARLGAFGPLEAGDLARRKTEVGTRSEADDLRVGIRELAHGLAAGQKPAEEPHGLEETERERLCAQGFFQFGTVRRGAIYSRIFVPARGGHRRRTSFLWRVETLNWLKLLSVT